MLDDPDTGLLLKAISSKIQLADGNHCRILARLDDSQTGPFLFLSLPGQVNTGNINPFLLWLISSRMLSLKLGPLLR